MSVYAHNELTLFPTDDPDLIQFEFGAPGPELIPTSILTQAIVDLPKYYPGVEWTTLQYGPSLGSRYVRETLATFLKRQYQDDSVSADHLCITSGASQSLFNILTLFTDEKTRFFIEDPTYFLAIRIFKDHGIESVTSIPIDENGVRVDQLEALLLSNHIPNLKEDSNNTKSTKKFRNCLYFVPTFSNPSGSCLDMNRRKRLIEIARKYDMLILCDDVYQCFNLDDHYDVPTRLVALDLISLEETTKKDLSSFQGHVISNGSFSKMFGPGIRVGWIEASPSIIQQFNECGLLYSGGSANHFSSSLINVMILNGSLERHFWMMKDELSDRMRSMVAYLKQYLPDGCALNEVHGGYFIWIRLPEHIDSDTLLMQIKSLRTTERKNNDDLDAFVSFTPGNCFSLKKNCKNFIRISFAFYRKEILLEGCRRLCKMFHLY